MKTDEAARPHGLPANDWRWTWAALALILGWDAWDVSEFGGVASYVSHWAWSLADGGPGHCFPAGHASAGFALLGGSFALRESAPRHALAFMALALAAGLVLGLAQQLRGAHFMSHTLWTAWICWFTALGLHAVVRHGRKAGATRPCLV